MQPATGRLLARIGGHDVRLGRIGQDGWFFSVPRGGFGAASWVAAGNGGLKRNPVQIGLRLMKC